MKNNITIRKICPDSFDEIRWVARGMRRTLVEVLGEARGASMYTMEWLVDRVEAHLEPERLAGEVFVAVVKGEVVGHTIVRLEPGEEAAGQEVGLFSTTYVEPEARRSGVGRALLRRGEAWMVERGVCLGVTFTKEGNVGLQRLYQGLGYTMSPMADGFVRLSRALTDAPM